MYQETFKRFIHLFLVKPELIACGQRSEGLSTQFANKYDVQTVSGQYHHACIAACMTEHQCAEQVIGVCFDSGKLGNDGQIWGGEFLLCDLLGYTRIAHFDYVPMPGGDKAAEEPWRMAIVYLYKVFGNSLFKYNLPFFSRISLGKIKLVLNAIERGVNCPFTSSVRGLFDAVAALIDLVYVSNFEAEALRRLEVIAAHTTERYPYQIAKDRILVDAMIKGVVHDIRCNAAQSTISAKVHNTITTILVELAERIRTEYGANKVILSGDVFQNHYLHQKAETLLTEKKFVVYSYTASQ